MMVKVPINFNEMKLIQVGIKSVWIDNVELKFINKVEKYIKESNSKIIIKNATAIGITPKNTTSKIHIVSIYRDLENDKNLIVHERTFGDIDKIAYESSNSDIHDCEIVITNVKDIEYTMEVKTKEEELEDEIMSLKNELKRLSERIDLEKNERIKAINKLQTCSTSECVSVSWDRINDIKM